MKKNYLLNLLNTVAGILFPILSFPYASKILGPVGIGKVQFSLSFAEYFALFAALGIPIYGIREVAKSKHSRQLLSKVFSELLLIYLISSLLMTFAYAGVISLPFFETDRQLYITGILIVGLAFSSIDWFYAGLEEFALISVRSIIVKLCALILLYTIVKTPDDYLIYLLVIVFSLMGNNIFNWLVIRKRVTISFKNLNLSRHYRPLTAIFCTSLAVSIYTIFDTVLLGFLADPHSVGLYTAGVKLTKISLPFVTSLGTILIPRLSKLVAEGNINSTQELLQKSYVFIVYFSIPISTGLALLAPEFIEVFSGRQFLGAVPAMRILSTLPVIIGLGHLFLFQIIVPNSKNKEMFFSVLGGVIISLLLNLMLIPYFKDVGAAIGNVGAEITVTFLYFFFIRKYSLFNLKVNLVWQGILASALFIPLVFGVRLVSGTNSWMVLILSIPLCAALYITFQSLIFSNNLISQYIRVLISKFNIST